MYFKKHRPREDDGKAPLHTLIQRLSLSPKNRSMRIIAFIAARPGEGTSTIARDYASLLAAQSAQKVLLIDAGPLATERFRAYGMDSADSMVDGTIDGQPPERAIRPIGTNVSIAHWLGRKENHAMVTKVIDDPKFWETLLASFDTIVIDAPSLQSSFDGVVLAARADATVLVVQAETTPQAVVINLRETLESSGAKLAGVVMNKRRYYIPQRAYRKL